MNILNLVSSKSKTGYFTRITKYSEWQISINCIEVQFYKTALCYHIQHKTNH